MRDSEQQQDPALRAANLALAGRRYHDATALASADLRLDDPRAGAWEVAAMTSVAVAAALVVAGLWFW